MKNFNSVMAAYLVVWGVLFVYSFTVSRRMSRLRDEIARLRATIDRGTALSAAKAPAGTSQPAGASKQS
ncbi:MAG TPA: CcmD family protein [Candidatus Acidoferrales bacterium]|nr:CcmD family protein [Candidatus Acidoferrales bacterium]